jgi:glucosamine--fructose-6-phosphate aminotransferase (isomerizing)
MQTDIPFTSSMDSAPLLSHEEQILVEGLIRDDREKVQNLPTDDPLDAKRQRRVDFTWDELWEQPDAIRTTLHSERQSIADAARYFCLRPIARVYLVGCGDSLFSMVGVRTFLETLLRIPCEPVQALDFAYYYHGTVREDSFVIAISSSGVTPRTVEALLVARRAGAFTLALSNTQNSPLMSEAGQSILVHAERKGWPTQSSTATMAALYQFAIEVARRKGEAAHALAWEEELHRTPNTIATVLDEHAPTMRALVENLGQRSLYLYSGGGPAYASALFGAAKLKECSTNHAIAIPLEEYHHYNSQKEGDPLFLVAPGGRSIRRAVDTAEAGKRAGGFVCGIVEKGNTSLLPHLDRAIELPTVPEPFTPLVYTVPLQLFAYHASKFQFRAAQDEVAGAR